ncbi:MAG: thiamine pyrophosphate-dependent enzyme [Polyangiales bacterium]
MWVVTGDGDGLSIGGNHLLHVLRRNVNLQILLFNNQIYGLTKGQYSPTSQIGKVTPSSPLGSIDQPLTPAKFALGAGARFVARGFDTSKDLPDVLKAAHAHRGASFIEILQNCPVFNDGVFETITDKKTGPAHQLWLKDGEKMIFGANNDHGIVFDRSLFALRAVKW